MGNQESKQSASHQSGALSSERSSHASSQHATSVSHSEKGKSVPRRRESVHTSLPGAKATASPSASLASATATTSKSSKASAEDYLKRAALPPPQAQPAIPIPQPRPGEASEAMGNSSSKAAIIAGKAAQQAANPTSRPSPLPRPIDVPSSTATTSNNTEAFSPALSNALGFVDASYTLATPSQFSRPPRLPLPIEQEVHAPGSPIISPTDISVPIDPKDEIPILRRTSILSSTTADDDDVGDDVNSLEPWNGAATVPTLLEWREDGERVYVTGTFAGWDKKFRLHRK
jgi:hypothetical protein